ncbi:tetratricopeptide repeat protein [Candidatus Venteria ishoeyi]|uniref:YfgM family protein n=1 Tax=Candidatus Venteria ishoeyi TaxID=1899563 RepID=UPI0025A5084B|nr:tetratricopeptide repeat protein [Candidatus Venteria ishoeyi]MDM8546435.1 tetratricopeptide repeat protein [Candidatus Venteria ishoeyi]
MKYETEEEQVEAIKKWWKENGNSVLIGLTLGFGLLFGWRFWQGHVQTQAELASYAYEQVLNASRQSEANEALQNSTANSLKQLRDDHTGSAYTALASLLDAKQKKQAPAQESLDWVISHSELKELKDLARLHKARLLVAEKNFDVAKTLLAQLQNTVFKSLAEELQGDMLAAQGDKASAAESYDKALQSKHLQATHRSWIQQKRDALGVSEGIISAANVVPAATPAPEVPAATPVEKVTDKATQTQPATTSATVAESTAPLAAPVPISATPVKPQ